jgi:hypothetical protein
LVERNPRLITGSVLSAAAPLRHLVVIASGGDGYRFFGASEAMARMAEQGSLQPALLTLGIVAVLPSDPLNAFAGAA